jgi:hypothetical protein
MTNSELPERSLFAEVEKTEVDEPDYNEDQEMILDLLDERDQLREKIDELEESNMWKMLMILAITTIYTCILIAVVDVKNNPEL